MNYWLAETTNLIETLRPLWDLMERSYNRGKSLAEDMYGCPGYVSHHNLDVWGDSNPHDNGTKWTMWPMSNLWLTSHMVEHYRFTGDKDFLRRRAWPLLQAAGELFDCYLFEFQGFISTGPSSSPGADFWVPDGMTKDGVRAAIDISPTMDDSLLYEFFTNYLEVASILGISESSDPLVAKALTLRDGLRPPQVGRHGQLQEWRTDYDEGEPGHRHYSHLYDLFPGNRFCPLANKTLANALRVSIERRLEEGGASTGWSRTWTAALYVRLLGGNEALHHMHFLLQTCPMVNLFNAIEGDTFQIDSNLGLVAAVAELLVQSHLGFVHLLPALSSDLRSAGSVSGLVARGGFEVSLKWDDEARLVEGKVKSRSGGKIQIRVAGGFDFKINGEAIESVETVEGETYTVTL